MSPGLILFAHGARDTRWADPLLQLKQRLDARAPGLAVELAFLELMVPDLPSAAATLVAQGCTSICVVPIFLGQGGHVRRDLSALLQTLRDAHPHIEVRSAPAVGEDAAVLDALAETACALSTRRADLRMTGNAARAQRHDTFRNEPHERLQPGRGRMLEILGAGRLVEHARREHDFVTLYRARDAVRSLTAKEFKRIMKFVEQSLDLALELVTHEPRKRKPRSRGDGAGGGAGA